VSVSEAFTLKSEISDKFGDFPTLSNLQFQNTSSIPRINFKKGGNFFKQKNTFHDFLKDVKKKTHV